MLATSSSVASAGGPGAHYYAAFDPQHALARGGASTSFELAMTGSYWLDEKPLAERRRRRNHW